MKNNNGFTLMELLLVVATLAIVAAAAAPTFTAGAQEALDESKKAMFYSAYKNAIFGSNLMASVMLTNYRGIQKETTINNVKYEKGSFFPPGISLDALNQWNTDKTTININGKNYYKKTENLNYYVPVESRLFTNLKGKKYFFSAKFGNDHNIVIYYVKYPSSGDTRYHTIAWNDQGKIGQEIKIGNEEELNNLWNKIKLE